MSADVLLGFGDSWARGSDLNPFHEKNYLELTSDYFGITFSNFSRGGSSIPHLIIQLHEFIENHYNTDNQYHAVFFLTSQDRTFLYDENNQIMEFSVKQIKPKYYNERLENYYKHIYTPALGTFYLNVTVSALQQICSTYNIKDYYLVGWEEVQLWSTVDRTKFFNGGKPITTLFTEDNNFKLLDTLTNEKNPYLVHTHCPPGHPNQQGHSKIAQALADWIKI